MLCVCVHVCLHMRVCVCACACVCVCLCVCVTAGSKNSLAAAILRVHVCGLRECATARASRGTPSSPRGECTAQPMARPNTPPAASLASPTSPAGALLALQRAETEAEALAFAQVTAAAAAERRRRAVEAAEEERTAEEERRAEARTAAQEERRLETARWEARYAAFCRAEPAEPRTCSCHHSALPSRLSH